VTVSVPRVLVVRNDPDDPLGPLDGWLREAGVEPVEVPGEEIPESLDGFSGVIVLGGYMGAEDDTVAPWLPALRALLREAVRDEVPTLGICLGAQLLAVANGGRVEPNPEGPEFGAQLVAKRSAAADDPLFRPLPIAPDVLQWHVDAITRLPAGAIELASSPVCANQAFRLGRLAWGIQFHIETTPALVREWAASDARALDGYDVDAILARSDAAHADVAETWRPFVAEFAAIVRDPSVVPAPRGVPTSTAAPLTDPAAIRAALAAEAQAARAPLLGLPTVRPRDDD
jgi:GMP synthase-like glutamine amidotransferase